MKERRTKAAQWRVSDAAEGGVTWKAASGAKDPEHGRVSLSDESRADVNRKGSLTKISISSAGAS